MSDLTTHIKFKTIKEYKAMNLCELQERLHNRLTDFNDKEYIEHKSFIKKHVLDILKAMKYNGDVFTYDAKKLLQE